MWFLPMTGRPSTPDPTRNMATPDSARPVDPTIPKNQSGHPIKHQFTRGMPSSQCMVCHMHPGTNMVTTYFGYTWWDNEVDGEKMYPTKQHNPTPQEEQHQVAVRNPEGAAPRGLWASVAFLDKSAARNF